MNVAHQDNQRLEFDVMRLGKNINTLSFNLETLSAEILMDDLRAHPKRYVNLSVFGRKDKGPVLTSPSKKDSIPK